MTAFVHFWLGGMVAMAGYVWAEWPMRPKRLDWIQSWRVYGVVAFFVVCWPFFVVLLGLRAREVALEAEREREEREAIEELRRRLQGDDGD